MTAALLAQIDRCRPWLEAALAVDAESDMAELLAELLSGKAQLWPGDNCAIVTQCLVTPEGRAIHAWCGGGKLDGMIGLRPGIEAWGRSIGALSATINSRPGWARLYGPFGYERDGDVLRKRL